MAYLKGLQRLRRLVLLVALGVLGFYLGGCLCPLGALQNLALPETTSAQKATFFVTLAIPLGAAVLFGRLYCGWICPAGALQEIVHYPKLARPLPERVDWWLKRLKYPVLVGLVAAVRATGEPVLKELDPFPAAFNVGGETLTLVALAVVLVASVLLYRPWCRYLCPMAVVFGVASRVSLFRLAPRHNCKLCRLCVKACDSQNLTASEGGLQIDEAECLSCGACREACHRGALTVQPRPAVRAPRRAVVELQGTGRVPV